MKSIKIMLTAISFMILIAILGIDSLIGGGTGYGNYTAIAFWLFVSIAVIAVIGLFQEKKN
jgi:hypothetical protein